MWSAKLLIINILSLTHLLLTIEISLRGKTYQLLASSPFQGTFSFSLALSHDLIDQLFPCIWGLGICATRSVSSHSDAVTEQPMSKYSSCYFPFCMFLSSRAISDRSPHHQHVPQPPGNPSLGRFQPRHMPQEGQEEWKCASLVTELHQYVVKLSKGGKQCLSIPSSAIPGLLCLSIQDFHGFVLSHQQEQQ